MAIERYCEIVNGRAIVNHSQSTHILGFFTFSVKKLKKQNQVSSFSNLFDKFLIYLNKIFIFHTN